MLVLGMLFGVLVAGPLLVLGTLALANNERAMLWLDGVLHRTPARPIVPAKQVEPEVEPHGDEAIV